MAQTLKQNLDRKLKVTLLVAATSGDVVILGNLLGIAETTGAIGDVIAIETSGIHELAADNSTAFVLGDLLYWDGTELTKTAAGNTFIGVCTLAKGSSTTLGLVKLNERRAPSDEGKFIIFDAGEFTTAGGDATETITVTDALATDIVLVDIHTVGSTPVLIVTSLAIADAITVTMSADPSTDHVLSYVVMRAV